jgi:hypothetical protein
MDQFFATARQGLGTGPIDLDTAVLKASLIRGYTYNAAHQFVSDVTGAGGTLVATSAALTTVTFVDGVLDFDDLTFTAVGAGAPITGLLVYQASAVTGGADVAAGAQRLIAILDGKFRFTAAAAAAGGATTIAVDPLALAVASGTAASLISGTGPATVTLGAAAAANARSATVTSLGSALSADAVYEVTYSGANLPITPNGSNITITFSSGANKVIRI